MATHQAMTAVVDFDCLESGCGQNLKVDLMTLKAAKGQLACPACHHQYQFDRAFLNKLEKLRALVLAVREAEDILGSINIAVTTPAGEVRLPYRLLLTRLNTLVSLDVNGKLVDFNFRVEPLGEKAFR